MNAQQCTTQAKSTAPYCHLNKVDPKPCLSFCYRASTRGIVCVCNKQEHKTYYPQSILETPKS